MKNLIILFLLFFVNTNTNAQNAYWNFSGNKIYPVNTLGTSSLPPFVQLGLGTANPTAQLHTISTVRFAGIANNSTPTRYIVSDASGNLGWQDITFLDNYFKKGGNTINNASTEFLGSTNYNDLIFRTNNLNRLTISKDGFVGIGAHTNPAYNLDIRNNTNSIISSVATGGESTIFLTGSGNGNTFSAVRFTEAASTNSWNIRMATAISTSRKLLFEGKNNGLTNNCTMEISNTGKMFFGIGTYEPRVALHVVDSVRFQNLPSGIGNVLVIDANGNVMRSTQTAAKTSNPKTEQLEARVALLENEIAELKKMIKKEIAPTSIEESKLYQNIPNPSADITFIKMQIQDKAQHAVCNIYDANNQLIQSHPIKNRGEINLEVNTQTLSSTMYFYTLEIDGKIIDTKKLVIVK